MLKVAEFDLTDVVRNSDGHIVASYGTKSYVAIYDDVKYDLDSLSKDIDIFRDEFGDPYGVINDKLVILPLDAWNSLYRMIKENYNVIEKHKGEE